MQKKIIALAVAALASSAAFAQTNVTIYGVADVGFAHVNAGGKHGQNGIESGLLSGSRLGFKGVEDLGNGLKAVFTLEYALGMDDNVGVGVADAAGTTSGASWSGTSARQQYVGLTGNYGTFVMGRLQAAGYDFACGYNPIAGAGFDTVGKLGAATLLSCGSGGRVNNAAAYISPKLAGFTLALNTARVTEDRNRANAAAVAAVPGNAGTAAVTNAGTGRDSTGYLASLKYENGPISATAIWTKIYGENTSHTAAALDDIREYGLGVSYDLKVVKLYGTYQNQKNSGVVAGVQGTKGSDTKWSLAAGVPVGKGTVIGSVAKNILHDNATLNDSSWAWNASYLHSLSKRTTVYAAYTHITNGNAASISGGVTNWTTPSTGQGSSILATGIRHMF